MLSIRGNNFIAHWAYEETILSHTDHTPKEFSRMLSQRKNINSFYMYSYAEHTEKWFYRTLNIRGNVKSPISRPNWIRFRKSWVIGLWDHKDSVSAKKVFKKISCLCTFKVYAMQYIDQRWGHTNSFASSQIKNPKTLRHILQLQIHKFLRCASSQIRKFVMINQQITNPLISFGSQSANPQIEKNKKQRYWYRSALVNL